MTTTPDHHPSVAEWFEETRAAPAPRWTKYLRGRCRYCGGAGLIYDDGRMRVVHAGSWSYNCSARPWWTFGRGHKARNR